MDERRYSSEQVEEMLVGLREILVARAEHRYIRRMEPRWLRNDWWLREAYRGLLEVMDDDQDGRVFCRRCRRNIYGEDDDE